MAKRTPPHDLDAEQALLGAMLSSRQAVEKVANLVTASDFYRPSYGQLYAVLMEMYTNGVVIDLVTVATELKKTQTLDDLGGNAGLMRIMNNSPMSSGVGRYAEIVLEMSARRKAIVIAAEIANRAYGLESSAVDIANDAISDLTGLNVRIGEPPEDLWNLDEFVNRDDIERPPWCIPGLLRVNHRVMVVAGEGAGKGLALDTPILLSGFEGPPSYLAMADITVGETLVDSNGNPCSVVAVSEIHHRPCFRFTTEDNHSVICDDQHRWLVTRGDDNWQVMETLELVASMDDGVEFWIPELPARGGGRRKVASIEQVESVPTKCIAVDSPDETYVAGLGGIVTHNTTLMRQIAITAAQGIHPFHHQEIPPVKALIIDLENPDDSIIDVCNPIIESTVRTQKKGYDPNQAWLWHRQSGINIRGRRDKSDLESVIAEVQPDLVCVGPLYKLYRVGERETDEQAALDVMAILDDLRTRYRFGLVIEHHAAKAKAGSKRILDPYGTSLWMRWPEFGISMYPERDDMQTVILGRFRGDRIENDWPTKLHRGQQWPWEGEWPTGTFSGGGGFTPSPQESRPVPRDDYDPYEEF